MGKYDGPEFNDPILRCTECQKLIFKADIQVLGKCTCGCRRVRNVTTMSESEMKLLQNKKIDPDFLSLFAPVEGISA